jgi:hypothetical protein
VTQKALEELQGPCEVVFVTDSSAIVLGFKNWSKKPIMESQYAALANLTLLRQRGNTVSLKWVPSHVNDDPTIDGQLATAKPTNLPPKLSMTKFPSLNPTSPLH